MKVMLTGATGLLGQHIMFELMAFYKKDLQLILVGRGKKDISFRQRVETILQSSQNRHVHGIEDVIDFMHHHIDFQFCSAKQTPGTNKPIRKQLSGIVLQFVVVK